MEMNWKNEMNKKMKSTIWTASMEKCMKSNVGVKEVGLIQALPVREAWEAVPKDWSFKNHYDR